MNTEEQIAVKVKAAAEKLKFYCPVCEKETDYALLDGYPVGDRLLEGVMFEARLLADQKYEVKPAADSEEYLEKLNRNKWLKAMQAYAEEIDFGQCPKCNEDVDMPFMKG